MDIEERVLHIAAIQLGIFMRGIRAIIKPTMDEHYPNNWDNSIMTGCIIFVLGQILERRIPIDKKVVTETILEAYKSYIQDFAPDNTKRHILQ